MREVSGQRPAAMLVTRNFPPLLGGMENVNQRLLRELAQLGTVVLCGPEGCELHSPEAAVVAESTLKPLPRFLIGATLRGLLMAFRLRPRLVMAGSGLTAPIAWIAARLTGARVAVYLHGLDIIAPHLIYQKFWLPFIRACDVVLVNSSNTAALAIGRGVPLARVHILHPGTEVPTLDATVGATFRAGYGLSDRPIMLSVGRLTRRKGLAEFVSNAMPAIVASHPSTLLVVVGEEASDALRTAAGSERDRITAAARVAGVAASVLLVGRCEQADLSAAYQAAQVHVFPVLEQAGDVEGFGMVALESAAHGLRTVAFRVGGIPDAVDEPNSGILVRAGEYQEFSDAVIEILKSPNTAGDIAASRQFAREKDWHHFGTNLRSILAETSGCG